MYQPTLGAKGIIVNFLGCDVDTQSMEENVLALKPPAGVFMNEAL